MFTKPSARRSDPTTSHAAAESVKVPDATATQLAILAVLEIFGPLTDEQIAEGYDVLRDLRENRGDVPPVSPSGLRTRRSELVAAGLVEDTGERGRTRAGRSCIVWGRVK